MEQYEIAVTKVLSFLKENNYSASVISQHKTCYQELQEFLNDNTLNYSFELFSLNLRMSIAH